MDHNYLKGAVIGFGKMEYRSYIRNKDADDSSQGMIKKISYIQDQLELLVQSSTRVTTDLEKKILRLKTRIARLESESHDHPIP